jgi:trehalose/maltose transport system substrate-binding protein
MLTKLKRLVAQRIRGLYAGWAKSGRMVRPICAVLLSLLLEGCSKPAVHEPVTLTLQEEWTNKEFSEARQQELQQFTRETGIRVSVLPSTDSARQRLAMWKELLGSGASGADVYGIDVIWPGILNQYYIDLKPYFANEISLQFPEVAASYTVDKKLVAVPNRADIGILFSRTDLLRQYGYREPPKTWDELESMAARIQAGERAKGKKQFWGFVASVLRKRCARLRRI